MLQRLMVGSFVSQTTDSHNMGCNFLLQLGFMCDRLSAHLAGGFSVFAGVGERTREGNDLYKEMTESVSHQVISCLLFFQGRLTTS